MTDCAETGQLWQIDGSIPQPDQFVMQTQTPVSPTVSPRSQRYVLVTTTDLVPGAVLRQPVLDEKDLLLLAAGMQITTALIQKLIARGVTAVRVHRLDVETASTKAASLAHLRTGESTRENLPTAKQRAGKLEFQEWARVQQHRIEAVDTVAGIFRACDTVRAGDLRQLEDLAAESITEIFSDADGCLAVDTLRQGCEYPATMGVQSSVVAISIGKQMRLNKSQLEQLGVGCLIHDLGLLRINLDTLRTDPTDATNIRLEISRHPTLTFELLEDVAQQAGAARIVAYQMHERCNGSGFPRGREKSQIHPLARIAAVADTYVRRLSPFHGPLQSAYSVLVGILRETREGLYDPEAVRGLLDSISLFAIGSDVQLTDGRIGRVIRANPENYMYPVVEILTGDGAGNIEIVPLQAQGPQIIRAL